MLNPYTLFFQETCLALRYWFLEVLGRESVREGYEKFSLHIVFMTICSMGTLTSRHKHDVLQCLKRYGIQPTD